MEKRKKKEHDFSFTAFRVVQEATGQVEPESDKPMRKIAFDAKGAGYLGGLIGGKASAAKLTPAERKEIAEKAARARWQKAQA